MGLGCGGGITLVVLSNTIGEDLLFFSNHFMVLSKLLAIRDKDFMATGANRDIKQEEKGE